MSFILDGVMKHISSMLLLRSPLSELLINVQSTLYTIVFSLKERNSFLMTCIAICGTISPSRKDVINLGIDKDRTKWTVTTNNEKH